MDYENIHQEPVSYEKPKKKRRWPTVLLLMVLVLGLSTVLHVLNFPAIKVEKTDGGLIIFVGSAAKAPEEKAHISLPAPAAAAAPHSGEDTSFAESRMILQEFLQTTMPGAEVEEVPLRARIYFDLPEGLHVRSVRPASAAARHGLCPGDIVTGLNGFALPGGPATITIFRSGRSYDLIILPG